MHRISISFSASVDAIVARRLRYVFSTFCAIYGFQTIPSPVSGSPCLCYAAERVQEGQVAVPGLYKPRKLSQPAPPPMWISSETNSLLGAIGVDRFPRFHGSENSPAVDWLGEAFEWISGAHEYSIRETDPIGRIPFARTLHGQYNIDPAIPWAGVCFAALNHQIALQWPNWPTSPQRLFPGRVLAIGASHDIDFLPVGRRDRYTRLFKNIVLAATYDRDMLLVGQILRNAFFGQRPSLKCSLEFCLANEQQHGIRSSYNIIVPSRRHRRDPKYRIDNPATSSVLSRIQNAGMEIGLHGSYAALDEPGRLAREAAMLRDAGFNAVGGRQHWLRYNGPALFREVARAGLKYDTSVGYADRPGFRTGACFPYAPYDFGTESCYPIVEIPLVIMDGSLTARARTSSQLDAICNPILAALRRFGWGGVSILWHDPVFSGLQIQQCIGDYYWQLCNHEDYWVAPCEIEKRFRPRIEAGMLL